MEVSSNLHAPAALLPGNNPPCPLDRRLGGPQSQSGWCGEVKYLFTPDGIRPAGSPSLYQLSYQGRGYHGFDFICSLHARSPIYQEKEILEFSGKQI
jgi:hypothetical protein